MPSSARQVGCKALLTAHSFKTSAFDKILREVMPELDSAKPGALASKAVPTLKHVITLGVAPQGDGFAARAAAHAPIADPSTVGDHPGMHRFADLLASASDGDVAEMQALSETLDCDDIVSLQLTSGTTGLPKATALSHHNIVRYDSCKWERRWTNMALGIRLGHHNGSDSGLTHSLSSVVMTPTSC